MLEKRIRTLEETVDVHVYKRPAQASKGISTEKGLCVETPL